MTEMKKSGLPSSVVAISLANTLVNLNHAQTASKIRSVSDAQNLVDFFHTIIQTNQGKLVHCLPSTRLDDQCHLGQHNHDFSWHVAQLVLEIYPRISLLPQSLFLNRTDVQVDPDDENKAKYRGVVMNAGSNFGFGISVSDVCFSHMTKVTL